MSEARLASPEQAFGKSHRLFGADDDSCAMTHRALVRHAPMAHMDALVELVTWLRRCEEEPIQSVGFVTRKAESVLKNHGVEVPS